MKRYIITAMIVSLLFGQAYYFSSHDVITLGWTCAIAIFLFYSLYRLYDGNRKTLRVSAKKDGWLCHFLSAKNPVFLILVAIIVTLLSSVVSVTLVKGLILQHGGIPFFFVIAVSSLILYSFVNKNHELKISIKQYSSGHCTAWKQVGDIDFCSNRS